MDQKNLNHHNDDDDDDGYDLSCNNDSFVTFNTTNLDELNRIIEESSSLDLPKSLIITNMDSRIFQQSTEQRDEFERAFRSLDSDVKFLYFKSFRRARLDFSDQKAATKARIIMNQIKFGDEQINCYFAEIMNKKNSSNDNDHNYLKPPALEKQFLISPPSSPPEGWEPCEEAQPILNIDLQSALANLIPGQAHELHPPTCNQPGIVVHINDL
ncbi:Calcipressin [Dermatophagoides pteronyssinus]|uniref:Calcipressin n=1 Tax=Dermatophagoides pteronyssinus TaxID=6956 RepID=A0ABQ8J671_DERPT|nr:Calcipressin [Dermatophagoides pteronyssinus]